MALARAQLIEAIKATLVWAGVTAVLALLLIKQIYVNLAHVPRSMVSAAVALVVSLFALGGFLRRARHGIGVLEGLFIANLGVVGLAALLTAMLAQQALTPERFTYGVVRYGLVPLVVFLPLPSARVRRALPWSLLGVSLLSLVFSVSEVMGRPFGYLYYPGWISQTLDIGLPRATGGVGTQIDLGFFSTLSMCFWTLLARHEPRRIALAVAGYAVALVNCVASFSRFYIAVAALLTAMAMLRSRLQAVILVALVAAAATQSGTARSFITDLMLSRDTTSQISNQNKLNALQSTVHALGQGWFVFGEGIGVENGPASDYKLIGDGYWVTTFAECGLFVGALLVAFQLWFCSYMLLLGDRSLQLRLFTTLLIGASLFNSAFANVVTAALFFAGSGYFRQLDNLTRPGRLAMPIRSRAFA